MIKLLLFLIVPVDVVDDDVVAPVVVAAVVDHGCCN